jgi:hypothetical protein
MSEQIKKIQNDIFYWVMLRDTNLVSKCKLFDGDFLEFEFNMFISIFTRE